MLLDFVAVDTKNMPIEIGGADDSRHSTQPEQRGSLTYWPPAPTVFHPSVRLVLRQAIIRSARSINTPLH